MHQESDEDQMLDLQHFTKRDEIKMVLSQTAQKLVSDMSKNSEHTVLLNNQLDPFNKAGSQLCSVDVVHKVEFEKYFIKHKARDERAKVFDVIRDLLIERGYNDISQIKDREEEQIMVVRVVEKAENALNTFVIEDEFTKDKIVVRNGFMWIGMICAVKAKWVDSSYKLEKIIDLATPIAALRSHLAPNLTVNRIMMVKGPFRAKFSSEDSGIRMITNQIKRLKKQNISINSLIVMGPILAKNNKSVQNFTLQRTYEEEYEYIVASLRSQINRISTEIQIYIMPGLDDIVSLYPIPQPEYTAEDKRVKVKYLSNPSSLKIEGRRSTCKIDLMNYDILKMIQTHKAGQSHQDLRQQLMSTYLKQPFWLSNTTNSNDPFDELNLGSLFNNGKFGDVVVFSSNTSPPFVNEVNGRIMLNVGALGVDYHYTGKNYMVVMGIYEGEGPANQRIKIQAISYQ